jgi:type IV leader peptidase family protein
MWLTLCVTRIGNLGGGELKQDSEEARRFWQQEMQISYNLFGVRKGIAIGYRVVRRRDGLGGGDAKLLAVAGAWVGWTELPDVVFLAALLGITGAVVSPGPRRCNEFDDSVALWTTPGDCAVDCASAWSFELQDGRVSIGTCDFLVLLAFRTRQYNPSRHGERACAVVRRHAKDFSTPRVTVSFRWQLVG